VKNLAFKVKVTDIQIEFTESDWELYSDMSGAEIAADKINKQFRKLILEHSLIAPHSVHAVYGKMMDVLDDYVEFGATDTEPRFWVREILRDIYGSKNCLEVF